MKPIEFVVIFHPDYFVFALAVLFAFGLWYNRWVEDQQEDGFDRGYMGLIVSLGCFVTLAFGLLWPTLNPYVFIIALGAFAASGIPMIRGSVQRFNKVRARKRMDEEIKALKHEVLEGGREPLPRRLQTLLEGNRAALREIEFGLELAKETLNQAYDPLFGRDSGNGEQDEDLVDGILWAIAEKVKGLQE